MQDEGMARQPGEHPSNLLAGPVLKEMVTYCPLEDLDHGTCPGRGGGPKAPHGSAPALGCSKQHSLTSPICLPGVILPSERDIIKLSTLQLSKVLGPWWAVLQPQTER